MRASSIVQHGVAAALIALYVWYFYFSDLPNDYRALRKKGWSRAAASSVTVVFVVLIVAITLFW